MQRLLDEVAPRQYKHFYIQYGRMKALIAKLVKRHPNSRKVAALERTGAIRQQLDTSLPEVEFRANLDTELARVNSFATQKARDIEEALRQICWTLYEEGRNWLPHELETIREDIEQQSEEIVHLDSYVRLNYRALVMLCSKYDQLMKITSLAWVMANFISEPFCMIDQDKLLLALNTTFIRFKKVKDANQTGGLWKPPESFVRNTTKYWVRQDMVVRAKTSILSRMPYLVFGATDQEMEDDFLRPIKEREEKFAKALRKSGSTPPLQEGDDYYVAIDDQDNIPAANTAPPPPPRDISESQLVSSVYLDNLAATCYVKRISRLEGAPLVRLRWYGDNKGESDKEVFIERKTHHEGWVGEDSVKERFSIPQKKVWNYLSGTYTVGDELRGRAAKKGLDFEDQLKNDKKIKYTYQLGNEITDLLVGEKLRPMVRTSYMRSAFQSSSSNDVRISLDVNLCMVNELTKAAPGDPTPPASWCRLASEVLARDDLVRFPYAVLEVKLQGEEPSWVSDMLVDCGAMAVFKFSKYQHGMSFLHGDILDRVRAPLPHWFEEFERKGFGVGFGPEGGVRGVENDKEKDKKSITDINKLKFSNAVISRAANNSSRFGGPSIESKIRKVLDSTSNVLNSTGGGSDDENSRAGVKGLIKHGKLPLMQGVLGGANQENADGTRVYGQGMTAREIVDSRTRGLNRVEPKSFFAAERTFLHYIDKGTLLGGLGFALLSFTGSDSAYFAGVIVTVLAVALLAYSLVVYISRVNAIASYRAHGRFDSVHGPSVVALAVFAVVAITLFLNIEGEGDTHKIPKFHTQAPHQQQ